MTHITNFILFDILTLFIMLWGMEISIIVCFIGFLALAVVVLLRFIRNK